jgi:uncharacterized protein YjaG (DUF416 family)
MSHIFPKLSGNTIELSVKSSKESIETVSLLKTGNKVVEDIVK